MKKLLVVLVLALAAGCPNDPGPDSNDMATQVLVPTNFTSINTEIFKISCANFSVCHSAAGASNAGNLDLQTDPYAALVGVTADNAKAKGEGKLRVDPCHPDNSFLLTKLRLMTDTDPKVGYGSHMPGGGNPNLPSAQIQAISDWISRGALKSEPSSVSGATCQLPSDGGVH
jgi:hypothetical protein